MIWLDDDLKLAPELLVQTGAKKLGVFHLRKPLKWTKHQTLLCKDVKLLYYYANRLNGFGFEEVIN
jgi:glycerol-3-phosphate O-acyltransferase